MRRSEYTKELAEAICEAVATQTLPLEQILANDPRFPTIVTVLKWRRNYAVFNTIFKRAKQEQAELYAEQTIKIADTKHTYYDKEGNERVDGGAVTWQSLQVKTRHWYAARMFPEQFAAVPTDQSQEAAATLLEMLKSKAEDKKEAEKTEDQKNENERSSET